LYISGVLSKNGFIVAKSIGRLTPIGNGFNLFDYTGTKKTNLQLTKETPTQEVVDKNQINTLQDIENQAIAVIKSTKGDDKYIFLNSQKGLFGDDLVSDDKQGQRIKNKNYKGIDIVSDYFTSKTIKDKSGNDTVDILFVDSKEDAQKQFDNYIKGGAKQFSRIEFKNILQVVDKNQLQKQNIEITNHNYTRQEVQNNPNTAYVFTENTYSITAFPNRAGGGSAIIRGLSNAFAIVTKKKYDYNTKENVDYTDTEVNFKEFTEVNTKLINELKNSGKEKIVFPQGFATDKAKMPTRFAEWLQKELLNNFGLITELNSTKTGLISKNISQVVDSGIDERKKITTAEISNLIKQGEIIYLDENKKPCKNWTK
jgi:hypothetical protein